MSTSSKPKTFNIYRITVKTIIFDINADSEEDALEKGLRILAGRFADAIQNKKIDKVLGVEHISII